MNRDDKVKFAIANWAPRFVANGVSPTDFQQVTEKLERWDDWCAAFSARAAVHEEMGREALAAGKFVTAGECLERAAVLYHFGKYLFVHDIPQMKAAHDKAVECRNLALPNLAPPGERVAIPYDGMNLYGTLRKPAGIANPPIVIMCMGLDSTKEEMGTNETNFLRRGMATLAFDGPGQGEAEYAAAIRGDYEVVVKAVVDFVETRDDVDAGRIGLWGVSLGGYYAPRAAAYEKRVKACIALSGPFNHGVKFLEKPELSKEVFRVRAKCATQEAAAEVAGTLDMTAAAKKITCSLFVVTGEFDRIAPPADAARLAEEAPGPSTLLVVPGGNHVANNLRYRYDGPTGDFMAEQLRAGLSRS
jgi:2,6-dihydroxypseudooxynicotine hydrolase